MKFNLKHALTCISSAQIQIVSLVKKKTVPESVYQELMSGEAPEYIYLLAAFGLFPVIMFKVNVSVNSDCCLFPLMIGIVTSSPCTSV